MAKTLLALFIYPEEEDAGIVFGGVYDSEEKLEAAIKQFEAQAGYSLEECVEVVETSLNEVGMHELGVYYDDEEDEA